jgi:hypothetical protein
MLVVRDCLMGVLGDRAEGIRGSTLFRMGIDWPTRATYQVAKLARYAPDTARVAVFSVRVAGIVVLILLVYAAVSRAYGTWMLWPAVASAGLLLASWLMGRWFLRRLE